jgi:hypothetical protein
MATKQQTVEWVTVDGVSYTTELEALLHDVRVAFEPIASGLMDNRPPQQRIEVAKQLLEFASRRSLSDTTDASLIDGVVAGFKQWR